MASRISLTTGTISLGSNNERISAELFVETNDQLPSNNIKNHRPIWYTRYYDDILSGNVHLDLKLLTPAKNRNSNNFATYFNSIINSKVVSGSYTRSGNITANHARNKFWEFPYERPATGRIRLRPTRNVNETIDWMYKVQGSYRGARGHIVHDITNKHIVINTTHALDSSTAGSEHDTIHKTYYDNETSYMDFVGNNGFVTFNHNHVLRISPWHDDFHRGHWIRLFNIEGENNVIVFNFKQDFHIGGDFAADTSGVVFNINGKNNYVILVIPDYISINVTNRLSWFGGTSPNNYYVIKQSDLASFNKNGNAITL